MKLKFANHSLIHMTTLATVTVVALLETTHPCVRASCTSKDKDYTSLIEVDNALTHEVSNIAPSITASTDLVSAMTNNSTIKFTKSWMEKCILLKAKKKDYKD
jgi:hypothetical protein